MIYIAICLYSAIFSKTGLPDLIESAIIPFPWPTTEIKSRVLIRNQSNLSLLICHLSFASCLSTCYPDHSIIYLFICSIRICLNYFPRLHDCMDKSIPVLYIIGQQLCPSLHSIIGNYYTHLITKKNTMKMLYTKVEYVLYTKITIYICQQCFSTYFLLPAWPSFTYVIRRIYPILLQSVKIFTHFFCMALLSNLSNT